MLPNACIDPFDSNDDVVDNDDEEEEENEKEEEAEARGTVPVLLVFSTCFFKHAPPSLRLTFSPSSSSSSFSSCSSL